MAKITNLSLRLDRSRSSSTFNAVSSRTSTTLTRNHLLSLRSLTIALCFVFSILSAHAQTPDIDKNWTTVGSAGTLDEKSVGKVFFDQSKVQMGQVGGTTTTGNPSLVSFADSAVIRYNVTAVDSFFAPRFCRANKFLSSLDVRLSLRYLAAGPGARVVAKLIEVDLATGSEKTLLTFDSAGPGRSQSENYQVQSSSVCGRPWTFDFQNKAYYIEATLTGSSIAATTAAGIQIIQIDNFTRPALENPKCAQIAKEIERLEKLPQSKAISLRILALEAESARLGCSGN